MPINAILLALAAGVISAVVFASATTGPALLPLVLFFLTPLSLYLAGLGLGPLAAIVAAISAIVLILLLANPVTGLVYAVSTAIPAVVLTRSALLSRSDADGVHWYPIGRIVIIAALFGGAFAALALILLGGDEQTLTKSMRSVVEAFKTQVQSIPGAPPLTDAQVDDIATTALKLLPWTLGMVTITTMLFNLWLAGKITQASGRLTRPWPKLNATALPSTAAWALLAAVALSFFVNGPPGLLVGGFAGAFVVAFAVVGLAVAHVVTERSPWRGFILTLLYASLAIFPLQVSRALAVIGIAETIFRYRARGAGQPPENSD